MTPDGEILVHERLNHLWEEQKDAIKRMAQSVQKEVNRQLDLFRSQRKAIHLEGLRILLVDDGIVTGFTVKAAILYLKRQGVSEIRIAVPLLTEYYPALNKAADDILALYPSTCMPSADFMRISAV